MISFFQALTYALGAVAIALTDGLAIPIIAGIAAGTQMAGTQAALVSKGREHQETVDECKRRQNRSEQRVESTRLQLQETLFDQESNFQSLETTALQVIVLLQSYFRTFYTLFMYVAFKGFLI